MDTMCGRFFLNVVEADLKEQFGISDLPAYRARYNIAPGQQVLTVYQLHGQSPVWGEFRWGLIPSWAKDEKIGYRMINARAETVAEKPSFRSAYRARRCLIPASGFYEWKEGGDGKTPYAVEFSGSNPSAFGGLWEEWGQGSACIRSCTIITRAAGDETSGLHPRAPLVVEPQHFPLWLDPDAGSGEVARICSMLQELPVEIYKVDRGVNNARNDYVELLNPISS